MIEFGGASNPALLTLTGERLVDAVGLFFDGSSDESLAVCCQTWWKSALDMLVHAQNSGRSPFLFVIESHVDKPSLANLNKLQRYINEFGRFEFIYSGLHVTHEEDSRDVWRELLKQHTTQYKSS